jgi:hypothetical protein
MVHWKFIKFFLNSLSVELKIWINSRALDLNQMLVTWVIRTSDILGKVSGPHSLQVEGLAHGGREGHRRR